MLICSLIMNNINLCFYSLVLANAEQFDSSTDSAHANSQSLALTNFNGKTKKVSAC